MFLKHITMVRNTQSDHPSITRSIAFFILSHLLNNILHNKITMLDPKNDQTAVRRHLMK